MLPYHTIIAPRIQINLDKKLFENFLFLAEGMRSNQLKFYLNFWINSATENVCKLQQPLNIITT